MIIRDPLTGTGARVNGEGRMEVESVILSAERHANQHEGRAYNAVFATAPTTAGDCFFYLKNQDDIDLVLEGIYYQASAAEEILIKIGDTGTAVKTDGEDIVPANLNAGSGNVADVLCYSETGDGGSDITGISGGVTIDKIYITAAADNQYYNFEQDVILPKNKTFTMYAVGGDVNIRGTVVFNFHNGNI